MITYRFETHRKSGLPALRFFREGFPNGMLLPLGSMTRQILADRSWDAFFGQGSLFREDERADALACLTIARDECIDRGLIAG